MNYFNIGIVIVVIACAFLMAVKLAPGVRGGVGVEGFRTKCFSCERQDGSGRSTRGYGSKCFSCERREGREAY